MKLRGLFKYIESMKLWPIQIIFYSIVFAAILLVWVLTLFTAVSKWFYDGVCRKMDAIAEGWIEWLSKR